MVYPIRHYFPDIRANHRPGCWKQLPLPVPHCWQYRRRLESIATVCIMIADPSLEVCVPRHLSRLWGRSAAVRQHHRVKVGTHLPTLLGLRQGQLYVAGDSDIRLSRCRKGGMRDFLSLYTIKMQVSLILLMRKLKIAKCTNTVMKFAHFCQLISASFIKNQPYTGSV